MGDREQAEKQTSKMDDEHHKVGKNKNRVKVTDNMTRVSERTTRTKFHLQVITINVLKNHFTQP